MGGGRGCYAGQPLTFFCARCRRSATYARQYDDNHTDRVGRRYETTGRTRPQPCAGRRSNHHRWPETMYEYRCLDCGHVGWSRHPDVMRQFNREHS